MRRSIRVTLAGSVLCLAGCATPGTWSFPLTTAYGSASADERLGIGVMIGPFVYLAPLIDLAILPVTAVHDLFFHEALAEPAAAPRAKPNG